MTLFYNTHHRGREGTAKFGVHANIRGNVCCRAPSKTFPLEGYKFTEFNGSSISDCSSAGSAAMPMSVSDRTDGEEWLSGKTGPVIQAAVGSAYPCQIGQIHMQPVGIQNNQSYAFARQCNTTQPKYYFQPKQMVVPSPGYVNMLPVHVQVPPMMISQPQSVRTPQVFNTVKQHDGQGSIKCMAISPPLHAGIMYPSNLSQVAQIQQFSPMVPPRTASTPFVNYVPSANNNPYRYVKTPVISHVLYPRPRGLKHAPPRTQLDTNNLLENRSSQRKASTLLPVAVESAQRRTIAASHESTVSNQFTKPRTGALKILWDEAPVDNQTPNDELLRREDEDLYPGSCNYIESEPNAGSSLFVSWSGSRLVLVGKLRHFKFEVVHVRSTSDETVFNVVFETHASARKAFTMQRTIRLRMVPPKKSRFKWLRNPSPKFLVRYETRRTLVMKKGKAESHDIVGNLLMSNSTEHKGCLVWADQLKGHRIRVVGYKGSLKCVNGKIVEKEGLPIALEGVLQEPHTLSSLGWISYRSLHAKERFVVRRSGNLLSDYIYKG